MTQQTHLFDVLQAQISPGVAGRLGGGAPTTGASPAFRGLLVTGDRTLVRAFQRELQRCADCSVAVDVQPSLDEAMRLGRDGFHWVAVDLDGTIAPSEGVRLARRSWPAARVAVLSWWWSERDAIARDLADVVIHKPLRSPEVLGLLRSLSVVSAREAAPAADADAPVAPSQEDAFPAAIA